jgi:hypothetical protein
MVLAFCNIKYWHTGVMALWTNIYDKNEAGERPMESAYLALRLINNGPMYFVVLYLGGFLAGAKYAVCTTLRIIIL